MPRDERNTYDLKTYDIYDSVTGARITGGSGQCKTAFTGRDDATSTKPVGGTFVYPTDYWGYWYFASPQAFDHELLISGLRRKYVGTTFGGLLASAYTTSTSSPASSLPMGLSGAKKPVIPAYLTSQVDRLLAQRISQGAYDFGQSIGELPELFESIYDLIQLVLNLWKAARRLDWRAAARHAKGLTRSALSRTARGKVLRKRVTRKMTRTASSLWLAYSYAWLPAIQDIYNVMEAVTEDLKSPQLGSVSAKASDAMPDPGYWAGMTILSHSFSGRYEVRGKVNFKLINPTLYSLSRYGVTNPLSVAWELVPLSFVVDWFVNVGSFFSALQAPLGLTFSDGYRTSFVSWNVRATWYLAAGNIRALGGSPCSYSARLRAFSRGLYVTFPIPVPQFRGLSGLNASKVASLLALAVR